MKAWKVTVICNDGAPDYALYSSTELWATEPTEEDAREIGRVSNGRGSPSWWWADTWTQVWVTGKEEAALRRGERPRIENPRRI